MVTDERNQVENKDKEEKRYFTCNQFFGLPCISGFLRVLISGFPVSEPCEGPKGVPSSFFGFLSLGFSGKQVIFIVSFAHHMGLKGLPS